MKKLSAISLGELRRDLGEVVNRATFAGERTAVTRHGKAVAAIVSVEDLALLDELERRADLEALRQARREDDGTRIPLDDFLNGQAS
ncbi:type II toxin-antitoxin system Phd/YefM family antitoxin [Corynebacterium hylobatis]|uniref:Antitoxin n=1 Tax=Corynebacterium hylobatis TaxID=1859290 RepID=A0A3S0HF06_9CORY|nr:type II toxin-antitoxin system Phd/YefM family antitoxin [Corynebacterium hylobatis]